MINERFFSVSGYVSVSLMAVMFALVAFRLVPSSYNYPLFGLAIAIYVARMVMRFVYGRQKKRLKASLEEAQNQ